MGHRDGRLVARIAPHMPRRWRWRDLDTTKRHDAQGTHLHRVGLAVALGVLLCGSAARVEAQGAPLDLTSLSLEELGDIRITSVSKKPERLADAAASVFVITSEDIRRSGARNLPDVLRLAPNLQVAQVSGTGYAISARGMNGSNTAPNKLLVLVDGRSIYTPLFSGVFWDVQDLMLEDVERIEVVSGPGGTLWGVNAVNGVINIVTRAAADTQGTLLAGSAGDAQADIALRHGGSAGASGHFRAYGKYLHRDATSTQDGTAVDDGQHLTQAGFRADWGVGRDRLSLRGMAYDGAQGQPEPGAIHIEGLDVALGDIEYSGANLTADWRRQLASGSTLQVQAYYDRTRRDVPPMFGETLQIVDLQLQHSLHPLGRHSLTWGMNARHSWDRVDNSIYFAFLPGRVQQDWTSLFLQDEVSLRDGLRMVVGARLERNDYTGTEFLPNARLAWTVAPDHLLWAAASRAVRAPSRLDRDAHVPGVPPFLLDGGDPVRSEIAKVYEVGYRGRFGPRVTLSATAFHTDYDDLRTQEIDSSFTFLYFGSGMRGRADGVEAWGTWQASEHWRLSAGFAALDETYRLKPGSNDAQAPAASGNNPSHSWQLRSSWDISPRATLDMGLRHVGKLDNNAVPAYTVLDARLGWQLRDGLELSLSGRNLLDPHAEYGDAATRSEIAPSVALALTWRR
ncbi:TonB-dependent receptor plug domain-containing protein [Lysobacter yangpyeongensis]|uniref:TonB-dependent receptor plug domain-containing protein n=1 Tax=Lysobacter yangpyeongensis TaxID=346182 RepID=A0ABW0SIS6_9GAMM